MHLNKRDTKQVIHKVEGKNIVRLDVQFRIDSQEANSHQFFPAASFWSELFQADSHSARTRPAAPSGTGAAPFA